VIVSSHKDAVIVIPDGYSLVAGPLAFISEIMMIFEVQIYFMWALQNSNPKFIGSTGKRMYLWSNASIFVVVASFILLSYLNFKVNAGEKQISIFDSLKVLDLYFHNMAGKIFFVQNIVSVILIVPFKFYIAKEFAFIFYDELLYSSLSNKIENLKKYTSIKDVYT